MTSSPILKIFWVVKLIPYSETNGTRKIRPFTVSFPLWCFDTYNSKMKVRLYSTHIGERPFPENGKTFHILVVSVSLQYNGLDLYVGYHTEEESPSNLTFSDVKVVLNLYRVIFTKHKSPTFFPGWEDRPVDKTLKPLLFERLLPPLGHVRFQFPYFTVFGVS